MNGVVCTARTAGVRYVRLALFFLNSLMACGPRPLIRSVRLRISTEGFSCERAVSIHRRAWYQPITTGRTARAHHMQHTYAFGIVDLEHVLPAVLHKPLTDQGLRKGRCARLFRSVMTDNGGFCGRHGEVGASWEQAV